MRSSSCVNDKNRIEKSLWLVNLSLFFLAKWTLMCEWCRWGRYHSQICVNYYFTRFCFFFIYSQISFIINVHFENEPFEFFKCPTKSIYNANRLLESNDNPWIRHACYVFFFLSSWCDHDFYLAWMNGEKHKKKRKKKEYQRKNSAQAIRVNPIKTLETWNGA